MNVMASYWRKTGLWDGRTRRQDRRLCRAKAGDSTNSCRPLSVRSGRRGRMFPNAAFDQFDAQKPWLWRQAKSGGGHYIGTVIRNSKGRGCCSTGTSPGIRSRLVRQIQRREFSPIFRSTRSIQRCSPRRGSIWTPCGEILKLYRRSPCENSS